MRPIDADHLTKRVIENEIHMHRKPEALISLIRSEPTIDITDVDVMLADAIEKEKRHYERITNAGLAYLLKTEPEHGHYIKGDNGEWYCSKCRRIDDKFSVARYCWYCGAKMDGEHETD